MVREEVFASMTRLQRARWRLGVEGSLISPQRVHADEEGSPQETGGGFNHRPGYSFGRLPCLCKPIGSFLYDST